MSEEACECEKVKILYRGLMQFKADSQLNLSVYHSNISVDVKLLINDKENDFSNDNFSNFSNDSKVVTALNSEIK